MELAAFLREIQWITAVDPEPEIYAENGVIYADFYSTLQPVAAEQDRHVSIDVYINGQWIEWNEVDSLPDGELISFRYAVTA